MSLKRFRQDTVENNVLDLIFEYGTLREAIEAGGGGGGGGLGDSFETVLKNLEAFGASYVYVDGNLITKTFSNGVVATYAYTGGDLTSITLSETTPGDLPAGVDTVKTFTYTDGDLTGVAYS